MDAYHKEAGEYSYYSGYEVEAEAAGHTDHYGKEDE